MTTTNSAVRAPDAVHHLTVSDRDGRIAEADITASADCVCLTFHVQSGHNRVDARPELMEAIFALEDVGGQDRIKATVPLGDVDLLNAIRNRCSSTQTRAAGASCLVDGVLTHCDQCASDDHVAAQPGTATVG
jgi:hypothetical protein